jgi:hypothetical protein
MARSSAYVVNMRHMAKPAACGVMNLRRYHKLSRAGYVGAATTETHDKLKRACSKLGNEERVQSIHAGGSKSMSSSAQYMLQLVPLSCRKISAAGGCKNIIYSLTIQSWELYRGELAVSYR